MQRNNHEINQEATRQFTICNACRYCEGFCAVFPSMERLTSFSEHDIHYLANLCHNCSECYYACQYAPPHEFAINIPQLLAEVRNDSYEEYVWPKKFAKIFTLNAYLTAGLIVLFTTVFILLGSLFAGAKIFSPIAGGDFYQLIPHTVLVTIFGLSFGFSILAIFMSGLKFWRGTGEKFSIIFSPKILINAIKDILQLKYLHNSGYGCTYPDEENSNARKWFHHFTFYGFLLCFAATALGTIYHYFLGLTAPYALMSLPVIFGTVGGIGLIIGPAGLWYLKKKADQAIVDSRKTTMEITFIALLISVSVTGLLLLFLRDTSFLGVTFALHLATVMAFFILMPYSKFIHGLYRGLALLKFAIEEARSR